MSSNVKPKQCRELFPEYRRVEEATRWKRLPREPEPDWEAILPKREPGPLHAAILAEERARLDATCERIDGALSRFRDPEASKDVRRRAAVEVLEELFLSGHITEWDLRRYLRRRLRARAS